VGRDNPQAANGAVSASTSTAHDGTTATDDHSTATTTATQ